MCGRYTLSGRRLEHAEKALHSLFPELAPRYNKVFGTTDTDDAAITPDDALRPEFDKKARGGATPGQPRE